MDGCASDSIRRESIASAQIAHGSGARPAIAASSEIVRSIWRPNVVADAQPIRWHAEQEGNTWMSSDANMAWRAHHARQWAQETAAALMAADVGEVQSHSLVTRMVHQSERRKHIMVDVGGSSPDRSVIDLTSTGNIRVSSSDEEE